MRNALNAIAVRALTHFEQYGPGKILIAINTNTLDLSLWDPTHTESMGHFFLHDYNLPLCYITPDLAAALISGGPLTSYLTAYLIAVTCNLITSPMLTPVCPAPNDEQPNP
jgi:hypothetical protein